MNSCSPCQQPVPARRHKVVGAQQTLHVGRLLAEGDRLSAEELSANATLLYAGHEITTQRRSDGSSVILWTLCHHHGLGHGASSGIHLVSAFGLAPRGYRPTAIIEAFGPSWSSRKP